VSGSDLPGAPDTVLPETTGMELDQLTVVLLFEGPRYHEYPPEQAQELANAHLAYTIGLVADGHLLHAGALIDQGSDPKFTGLGFSRLSHDDLRPLIAEDPSVAAGLEDFRLVTHAFPKGSVVFPAESKTGA
jgi:hypothetical protein